MLAPFLSVVTLLVLQSCLPVAASRHTSSPEDMALKMYSPCNTGVEVLLNMRFEGRAILWPAETRGWRIRAQIQHQPADKQSIALENRRGG